MVFIGKLTPYSVDGVCVKVQMRRGLSQFSSCSHVKACRHLIIHLALSWPDLMPPDFSSAALQGNVTWSAPQDCVDLTTCLPLPQITVWGRPDFTCPDLPRRTGCVHPT